MAKPVGQDPISPALMRVGVVAVGALAMGALVAGGMAVLRSQRIRAEQSQRWAVCYAASLSWLDQERPKWSARERAVAAAELCDAQAIDAGVKAFAWTSS